MNLSELRENPNNPSKATDEQLERLAGKIKRVPLGLTAMRIAYVTDDPGGGKMVISGNKRLRVLKKAFGDDADLPDEYFQDVTKMSEAERHEFIVTANVSDGDWDLDLLLRDYDEDLLKSYGLDDVLSKLPSTDFNDVNDLFESYNPENKTKELKKMTVTCPDCGKEFEVEIV